MPLPSSAPMNAGPVSPADIDVRALAAAGFPAGAIEKGQAYQRQGRVSIESNTARARTVTLNSRVRGSRAKPYAQTITIARSGGDRVAISCACSCPMASHCKHVAAVLLQWCQAGAPRARAPAIQPPTAPANTQPELPPALSKWLRDVAQAAARADESASDVKKRLCYVLNRMADGAAGVDVMAIDLDNQGRPKDAPKLYDPNHALNATPPKFLRASDLSILPRLMRAASAYAIGGARRFRLGGAEGASILAEIVATGRARWQGVDGPLLRMGEARAGEAHWSIGEDGAQRFGFRAAGGADLAALALSPPHCVDPATGEVGALATHIPAALVAALLAAPPAPPEAAESIGKALDRILPPGLAPKPRPMPKPTELRPVPRPIARLTMKPVPRFHYQAASSRAWYPAAAAAPVPALELTFAYEDARFRPSDAAPLALRYDGARVLRINRNPAAELQRLKRLAAFDLEPFPEDWSYGRPKDRPNAMWFGAAATQAHCVRFVLDAKPALEAEGWTIEVDPDFPVRLAEPDEDALSLDFGASQDSTGIDWFDASLGIVVDGERHDLLPSFAEIIAKLPPGMEAEALSELAGSANPARSRLIVTLPDGRILPLSLTRIVPILQALLSVWGPAELADGARLHAAQAGDLVDLEARLAGQVSVVGAANLAALATELAAWRARAPAATPPWFTAKLRPYQQIGVDWLQMLSRVGLGGVLADDMGLGKTIQVLAHLAIEKAAKRLDAPALVVAPTSVLANWQAEAERFAPRLTTLIHQGKERSKQPLQTDGVDLVITSYPLLARDRALLLDRRWSVAVLDEAQTIRNPQAGISMAAFALEARQRLALSGTPVENHLGDAWSLMRFLNPGLLGDAKSFRALYRNPIEKEGDAGARARLARRIKPFLLRRTKAEVAADLPPKTEIRETVVLTPAQRQLYEATRLIMQKKVREALDQRGLAKSAIVVLDALLKLRQACCDPRLVKSADAKAKAGGSAKLERLEELIASLKEEGRSALVFSQFTSMLELIRERCQARGWAHEWLTGDTADRASPVARFQAGEADLFLISLKAGGTGLNLTRADTVILYDPWWNPAVEAQAIDRAHRIGQTAPVFVHRLIAEDTIEEKMLTLQARKQSFADALWDGQAGGIAGISAEDVRALFA
jgi:superfamily II DNA or RNA helicase